MSKKNKVRNKVKRCCANCEYWDCYKEDEFDKFGEVSDGECHRYPCNTHCIEEVNGNIVLETFKATALMTHPITFAGDWCGEFKRTKNPRW